MFDPLQVFLSAPVGVKESERCAILFGGGPAVSLFFQQLAQQIVGFEGRAFLDGRGKIAAQQANGQRSVSRSVRSRRLAPSMSDSGRSSGLDSMVRRACSISSRRLA